MCLQLSTVMCHSTVQHGWCVCFCQLKQFAAHALMLILRKNELFQMSNWTGMRTVHKRGRMALLVDHIDGVTGSSPVAPP